MVISGTGTALFSAAFTASILNPGYVEEVAEAIIRLQVQRSVHEKIDALDAKFLSGKAVDLFKRQGEEIEIAKRQLKEKAPERIASVIGEMRNLDCECRKKIERTIREGIELRITTAAQAQDKLTAIIQTKYMEVADKLTREFRIFTCTNALVFALLGIGAFFKRGGGIHLIPAALVMVVAAVITGYLYLFNQNWLHTILFSDYVGFTYVVYLSIVFAFLCDILFNRARVTTEILNATFQAIGSSLQVVPC